MIVVFTIVLKTILILNQFNEVTDIIDKNVEELDMTKYVVIPDHINGILQDEFPLSINIHNMTCDEATITVNVLEFTDRRRTTIQETLSNTLDCAPNKNSGSIHSFSEFEKI
jgi:hypothetical protein